MIEVFDSLGAWTYVLAAAFALLETAPFVGMLAPGGTAVVLAGVAAGRGGVDPLILLMIVWLAAALGEAIGLHLGRRLGRGFVEAHGPRVGLTAERVLHVEAFGARYGARALVAGRFVEVVSALGPFMAGVAGMGTRRFMVASVLGTALWSGVYLGLGYVFSSSATQLLEQIGQASLWAAGAAAAMFGGRGAAASLPRPGNRCDSALTRCQWEA